MNHRIKQSAFTLWELMIVVLIISIIAMFALPAYQTAVARAHTKKAVVYLYSIYAAEQAYQAKYGVYYPQTVSSSTDLNALNTALNINADFEGATVLYSGEDDGSAFYIDVTKTDLHHLTLASTLPLGPNPGPPVGNPGCDSWFPSGNVCPPDTQ